MATDWVNEKLYWADTSANSVSVSDYDGNHITSLIKRDKDFKPRAIALHPSRG